MNGLTLTIKFTLIHDRSDLFLPDCAYLEFHFKSEKLGDRLSYSAQRTVHLASLQVGDNIGQNVALKMMQKQLITQSGGFPYLQMEKEVYH